MDVMQDIENTVCGCWQTHQIRRKGNAECIYNVFIKCKGVNEGQIIIIFKQQQKYCTYYM